MCVDMRIQTMIVNTPIMIFMGPHCIQNTILENRIINLTGTSDTKSR